MTDASKPIFQDIFGSDWEKLPKVMRDHYMVRPYSDDRVVVEGTLDVRISLPVRIMSLITGALLSRSGDNVPITVTFTSGRHSGSYHFNRAFRFPAKTENFISRMEPVGGNKLIEFMALGVGWKTAYSWDGEKVFMAHCGYVWRFFGFDIPIPLGLVLGKGEAAEIPREDGSFDMWMHARHPLFGDMMAYSGNFKVTEVSCPDGS